MADRPAPRSIGVVIATYNQPTWLDKVLTSYECQTDRDFRTIIADDGSGDETRDVIEQYRQRGRLAIDHHWHEDDGFRKCAILNTAIAATDCDYLLFTDGDCVALPDMIEVHRRCARPALFLSGGYVKLTMTVSTRLSRDDIRTGRAFSRRWLIKQGQPRSHKLWRLIRAPWFQHTMNALTPTRPTWNGACSSAWTADLRAVNGFNEDMQYFGLDRELGERLWNYNIRSKQIRFSAVCLHLDHARGYDKPEIREKNMAIRRDVRRTRAHWTANGIVKSPAQPAAGVSA